jgi:hypothetical protein
MKCGVCACVGTVAIATGMVQAQPVVYSFTGQASGFFDAVAFTDVAIEINLSGDLADVFSPAPGLIRFEDSAATLDLDGFASGATFNPTLSVVSNQNSDVFVLGNATLNLAIAIFDDPAFVGYDLGAPFGPITEENVLIPNQFNNVGTSQGLISVTNIRGFTFEASIIPAPGATAALALAGLTAARRRR